MPSAKSWLCFLTREEKTLRLIRTAESIGAACKDIYPKLTSVFESASKAPDAYTRDQHLPKNIPTLMRMTAEIQTLSQSLNDLKDPPFPTLTGDLVSSLRESLEWYLRLKDEHRLTDWSSGVERLIGSISKAAEMSGVDHRAQRRTTLERSDGAANDV